MAEPEEWFPTREDLRQLWPERARDLLVAKWQVDGALAGDDGSEIDIEDLDPQEGTPMGWLDLYARELDRFPVLRFVLTADDPVAEVIRRAGMPANEAAVFRMWGGEHSVRDIAVVLGKPRSTVHSLFARARYRVLEWLVRSSGTDSL